MSVSKRLFQYALTFKKSILVALALLTVAVAAELTGPFIAKKMIDTHILGVEFPWYETAESENAVQLHKRFFIREDRIENHELLKEVRILQVSRDYYFIDEPISFDGKRELSEDQLRITNQGEEAIYPVVKLSSQEAFAFFKPEVPKLILLMLLYFGLICIASVLHYGQKYLLQTSANKIIQKMRLDVFAHIQKLPVSYFDRLPAGKIVSRVTNDTEAIRDLYVTVLATFFTSIIYMAGIYIALFLLDAKLALICLILVPILVVWIKFYRVYASKYNHRIRSVLSEINGMINESIQGMRIIQAFGREKKSNEEFNKLNKEHFTYQSKLLKLNSLTSHNLVGVFRNLAFVALIWYFGGASLGVGTVISLGVLYAFVDYLNRLFQPISQLVNQLAQLEQARVAGERVFELLDETGVDVSDKTLPRYKGNVRFENVSFAYTENDHVLKNISFEAMQGDTVALVGHTGSGKSSIMNVLFRFYDHSIGKITIDGIDILNISKQELREHMGIVLQDPFLFTGTIASNISLNDPRITREQVEKAIRDVGADKLFDRLEKGLDEPVIEKGSTLSAGERQLISFARALAFNPAILILDEATASVDTETEAIIQDALEVLKQGRTTFIIAHRLSTIKNADQILVLDGGRIIEKGNHNQLMQLKGKYYQMYQLQIGKKIENAKVV
ncbi:ABC transporter ATP-binding protein [Anaerobacillus isosaccharinicus]|uniref:ABC transporter ATP-binding protein n=1 Tax=Anaerobacillus isosaccharinicus TaxID=1532552 RepID=A0A1S2KUQ0_9BACI|nr:ABC transporter ATP-binding protein [Anaerobacillus isosaccharinicus]MBA5585276.1 ABC transporter ATP-binding protein [Anaerobacillus isosaccharinicus]QOY36394.1 ABC transporter ATP-binding protein [Anaerobacillus isosaccharinicus]